MVGIVITNEAAVRMNGDQELIEHGTYVGDDPQPSLNGLYDNLQATTTDVIERVRLGSQCDRMWIRFNE